MKMLLKNALKSIKVLILPLGTATLLAACASVTSRSPQTIKILKKMWEPSAQGKIKRWNQVRPDFPDKPLNLFGAGKDSGTFDYFAEAIVGKEDSSRTDYFP